MPGFTSSRRGTMEVPRDEIGAMVVELEVVINNGSAGKVEYVSEHSDRCIVVK